MIHNIPVPEEIKKSLHIRTRIFGEIRQSRKRIHNESSTTLNKSRLLQELRVFQEKMLSTNVCEQQIIFDDQDIFQHVYKPALHNKTLQKEDISDRFLTPMPSSLHWDYWDQKLRVEQHITSSLPTYINENHNLAQVITEQLESPSIDTYFVAEVLSFGSSLTASFGETLQRKMMEHLPQEIMNTIHPFHSLWSKHVVASFTSVLKETKLFAHTTTSRVILDMLCSILAGSCMSHCHLLGVDRDEIWMSIRKAHCIAVATKDEQQWEQAITNQNISQAISCIQRRFDIFTQSLKKRLCSLLNREPNSITYKHKEIGALPSISSTRDWNIMEQIYTWKESNKIEAYRFAIAKSIQQKIPACAFSRYSLIQDVESALVNEDMWKYVQASYLELLSDIRRFSKIQQSNKKSEENKIKDYKQMLYQATARPLLQYHNQKSLLTVLAKHGPLPNIIQQLKADEQVFQFLSTILQENTWAELQNIPSLWAVILEAILRLQVLQDYIQKTPLERDPDNIYLKIFYEYIDKSVIEKHAQLIKERS